MGKILCATRGGPDSLRTQDAAIELVRQTGDELIFFIAYDVQFMQDADFALRSPVVATEIDRMCNFIMAMAVEHAEQQGVKARFIVCRGPFVEELKKVVRQEHITRVILGRPGDDASRFKLVQLQSLCEDLQAETGIPFEILPKLEAEMAGKSSGGDRVV